MGWRMAAGIVSWLMVTAAVASADQVDLAAAETQFKKSCGT
jgi:hypothetical protein